MRTTPQAMPDAPAPGVDLSSTTTSAPEPGAARSELLREVVGGREAVDAGADDDVGSPFGMVIYCLLTNRVAYTRTAR